MLRLRGHGASLTGGLPVTLERLAQLLTEAGLPSAVTGAEPRFVMGGTARKEFDGIALYENSFAVHRRPDGRFDVVISGPGQTVTEQVVLTLDESLQYVLGAYVRHRDG